MHMPAVSVIIPCYNAEKYLDMCMKSLLDQTLEDIELICVDDGSSDSTPEILNRYAETDSRVRVLSQQNKFAGAARNLGLAHARGEYVVFLDSDDFFEKDLVQESYSLAKAKDADVVLFDAQYFDESTGENRKGWFLNTAFLPEKQPFCHEDCPDDFYRISTPSPWTKLFRRQFLLDTGLQFQTLRHTNDSFFILCALAMAKRIVTLDKVLVHYRVGHTTNLQSTKSTEPLCFYAAYQAWHDKLEELGLLDILRRSYVNQAMGGCLFNLRSTKDPAAQRLIFDKLREEIFQSLEIPDREVTYYFTETDYNEMLLVRNGTFEQYQAFRASQALRDLWHALERGIRHLAALPYGEKPYRLNLSSFAERILRLVGEASEADKPYAHDFAHMAFNREGLATVPLRFFTGPRLYQKFDTLRNSDYAAMQAMLRRRLVVSMTSYPARIHMLGPVLDSLYAQDKQADEILLWLAEEEFPGKEADLPENLRELAAQGKLTIRWCDNLKPHKKYFYAFQEYPEDLIVTVDDDLLYSKTTLSSLHASYLQCPFAVSAVRVHLMLVSENTILPYNTWVRETDCCLYTPSMQLFATGGAGTLYPPELFRKEFFDREAISAHCPLADDLWLKAMEAVSGVPVVAARKREELQYLPDSQEDALKLINDTQEQNDVQLAGIIRWTDKVFGKDVLVKALASPDPYHPILGLESVTYHVDQERRGLRQQLRDTQDKEAKTKATLRQTEKDKQKLDGMLKQTSVSLNQAQRRLRQTQDKLTQTEALLQKTEAQLKTTKDKLRRTEESKPIGRQLKALGATLHTQRKQGLSLKLLVKYLVYYLAWIPETILAAMMYFLQNGAKHTLKQICRKLLRRG